MWLEIRLFDSKKSKIFSKTRFIHISLTNAARAGWFRLKHVKDHSVVCLAPINAQTVKNSVQVKFTSPFQIFNSFEKKLALHIVVFSDHW